MLLFLAMLPFTLVELLAWPAAPIASISAYLLLKVEETAVQIEQPFGLEYNDLPLEAYTLTVEADVLRLLDESSVVGEDLEAERIARETRATLTRHASSHAGASSLESWGSAAESTASLSEDGPGGVPDQQPPLGSTREGPGLTSLRTPRGPAQ
jgi:hypothetical protein